MTPSSRNLVANRLHQADAVMLAVLSTAVFAVGLLLAIELCIGTLTRLELDAVIAAGITLGLIQIWFSLRAVLALTLWAASRAAGLAGAPWRLAIWWFGAVPSGWLGLAFPGHAHHPAVLVLSLAMMLWSAQALTQAVHAAEAQAAAAPLE
ncbi:MAG: hypothetical protein WDO24_17355 [Pseudomonadota bacterium]